MAQPPSKTAGSSDFSWDAFRSHIRRLEILNQHKVKEAFELSMRMHEGQARKSGEPYFSHPFATAQILAGMHADTETLIAALLHDALEDTALSKEEIEKRFGSPVCLMVDALTKLNAEEFAERPTLDEQIESLRKIFMFMQEDVRIIVVKLADRLHNMQTDAFLSEERRLALAKETRDVYVKIADRLSMQDMRDQLEELCFETLDPALLAEMLRLRTDNERKARTIIPLMQKASNMTPETAKVTVLQFEQCRFRKLKAQLDAGGGKVTGLTSLTIVCVCDAVAACYQTLGVLHQNWQREAMSFEDFINAPMVNGYRGLHTTIILDDGTRVRCKIRTREMQEYARKGITTRCFTSGGTGLSSYVAWGKHISPLSIDTSDRSREFWDSLQSDILGESIIAYCADGRSIQLPRGATALDAAFYFFGEQAFRVKSVIVNGKPSAFHSTIEHTATVAFEFARRRTIEHQWISWVKTGLALAKIREGLSQESREKKIERGKQMLEQVMVENRRGLLAEFSEESTEEGMQRLGFPNLEEGYVALAEGRVENNAAYDAVFIWKKKGSDNEKRHHTLRFFLDKDDMESIRRLMDIYNRCQPSTEHVHISMFPLTHHRTVKIDVFLSQGEAEILRKEVLQAGGKHVTIGNRAHHVWQTMAVSAVVLLWGFDPVVASWILSHAVTAFDLAFMRFIVFFLAAAALYVLQRSASRTKFKPLSLLHPSLLLSGVVLFVTGISTYLSLSLITPIQYILLIIAGGVTLSSLLRAFFMRKSWMQPATVFLVCMLTIIPIAQYQGTSLLGLLFGFLSGVSFGFYTEVSRRYQEEIAFVRARFPVYLFWLSLIALVCALPLLLRTEFFAMDPLYILFIAIFALVFVFLPYGLYYMLVRSIDATVLDRQLLFVCMSTMVGEILFTHSLVPLLAFPVLFALMWWEYADINASQ